MDTEGVGKKLDSSLPSFQNENLDGHTLNELNVLQSVETVTEVKKEAFEALPPFENVCVYRGEIKGESQNEIDENILWSEDVSFQEDEKLYTHSCSLEGSETEELGTCERDRGSGCSSSCIQGSSSAHRCSKPHVYGECTADAYKGLSQLLSFILKPSTENPGTSETDHLQSLLPSLRSDEDAFKCEVCGHQCHHPSDFKCHMRIHTGEKPYICEICGKCFAVCGNLNVHMRIHTGDKPYKCTICEKGFAQQNGLKRHLRAHTGQKPYKCAECQKSFCDRVGITYHMKSNHLQKKYHKCAICEKRFLHHVSLKAHLSSHSVEGSHKCAMCGKSFCKKSHIKRHIINIHGSENI